MDIKVKHQDGKTWIEGLKGWTMRQMTDDIHAARYTVLQALGKNVSYEELLGVSSMAFRLQVTEDLCPSSANSFCGFRCCVRSLQLLPWSIRILELNQEDPDTLKDAQDAVMDCINRGIPVHYGNITDGVIFGYLVDGPQWLCLHPMEGRKEPFIKKELPGTLLLPGEPRAENPDNKKLALEALKQAVEMANTKTIEEYAVGFHAWEVWLRKLAALQKQTNLINPEIMWGNAWIYFSLVECRHAAAKYLHSITGCFDQKTATHLNNAAMLYEQIADALLAGDDNTQRIVPFPQPPEERVDWKPEQMREQAGRLTIAFESEKKAIAEIEAAIASD